MYRRLVIMTVFNFMGRFAIISLSLIMTTALASEDSSQQSQVYYLRHSWPPRDLITSASFPIGYGIGGAGFLPKGGFLGVGGLGGYGGGYHGGYGDGGFIGGYGGGPYGGYGGFGGLQKSLAGSGYSKGQSGLGAQKQAAGYEAGAGHKGQTGLQNSQGYSGAEDAKKQNQQSSGFYGDEGGEKKKYEKGGSYDGASNYGQAGKKQSEVKSNQDHKKGHSTKGYQNYHHKDESSKSTTFFDESNDEGDHYDYQGQQGAFGGEGGSSFKGAQQDGSFASDAKGKQGHYNSGYATDNQHGGKGSHSNQAYYGDNEDHGQKKAFDDYGNKAALEHQQGYGGYHGQQYGGFKKGGHFGGYGGGLGGHSGYVGHIGY